MEVKSLEELNAATAEGKVIVDFWATWCGPCLMMGEKMAAELEPAHPEIKIVKVNVDEAPEIAASFGIMSIPALFCYKNGKKVKDFIGVTAIQDLLSALA